MRMSSGSAAVELEQRMVARHCIAREFRKRMNFEPDDLLIKAVEQAFCGVGLYSRRNGKEDPELR